MKIKKIFKTIAIVIVAVIIIALLAMLVSKAVNLIRINSNIPPAGINERDFIEINGIKEFVQIRGADKDNPVIVFLHGGPGSNSAYISYTWELELEKDFTILHYDQRASGNTYYKNPEAIDPSVDQLVSDLDATVDYARERLGKDKVIIVGHSWGTMLGAIYSQEYADKVSHFISIGQLVDSVAITDVAATEGIRLANESGDSEHVEKIEKAYREFREYTPFDIDTNLELIATYSKYLPSGTPISFIKTITMGLFSPDMTISDLRWYLGGSKIITQTNSSLYAGLFIDGVSLYDRSLEYKMPVTFISGTEDWVTPVPLTEEYFDRITAPDKELCLIEGAGHVPYFTHRDEVLDIIKEALD